MKERLESLKWVVMAGEALEAGDVGRWRAQHGDGARLVNLYGTSETTMAKLCYMVEEGDERRRTIPIGKPIPGAQVFIADAHGKLCPPEKVGEIYIGTPYRSHGYYQQEILLLQY